MSSTPSWVSAPGAGNHAKTSTAKTVDSCTEAELDALVTHMYVVNSNLKFVPWVGIPDVKVQVGPPLATRMIADHFLEPLRAACPTTLRALLALVGMRPATLTTEELRLKQAEDEV